MDGSPTRLAANGPHIAGRPGRARRRSRYRETAPPWFQLPWPRSRACRFRLWTWAPPPRRCRRALCAGHPLHPMTAGHATDPKQGRDYRYRRPDRHCLRIGYSRSPGGAAKAVLSPSSPPPERPRPHSLRGAPGSRGAARLLCNFHACGPLPGSAPGSTETQVLTFGMSSQRVV